MAKLSISRAWEESKGLTRRDGKLLSTVALALFVLPGAVAALFQPAVPPGQLPEPGFWLVLAVISMLIGLVGQLTILRLATGSSVAVGEAIGDALRRLLPFLGAILLVLVPLFLIFAALVAASGPDPRQPNMVAGLLTLLFLPVVIYLAIRLLMMAPVASAEPVGPLGIVRRSWTLTRGNWWRLFAFFVLIVVAAAVVLLMVGAVIGSVVAVLFGEVEPLSVAALLVALITQMVAAAFTVLLMVMLARIYVQLADRSAAEVSVPGTTA